jgi:FlaA1/EpsC-like NDP-sugar epimerase
MTNFWATVPLLLLFRFLALRFIGLYRFHWLFAGVDEVLKLIFAVCASSAMLLTTANILEIFSFSRGVILTDAALAILLLGLARFGLLFLHHVVITQRADHKLQRVIVVGAGSAGEMMLRECRANSKLGLRIIGFLDDDPDKQGIRVHGVPVLGTIAQLNHAVRRSGADLAILAIQRLDPQKVRALANSCSEIGIRLKVFSLSLHDGVGTRTVRVPEAVAISGALAVGPS